MNARERDRETDTIPTDLRRVRSELERLVEHRVLGGLTEHEERRYYELARVEERLLRAKEHRAAGR